jgi:hypothetical protein
MLREYGAGPLPPRSVLNDDDRRLPVRVEAPAGPLLAVAVLIALVGVGVGVGVGLPLSVLERTRRNALSPTVLAELREVDVPGRDGCRTGRSHQRCVSPLRTQDCAHEAGGGTDSERPRANRSVCATSQVDRPGAAEVAFVVPLRQSASVAGAILGWRLAPPIRAQACSPLLPVSQPVSRAGDRC